MRLSRAQLPPDAPDDTVIETDTLGSQIHTRALDEWFARLRKAGPMGSRRQQCSGARCGPSSHQPFALRTGLYVSLPCAMHHTCRCLRPLPSSLLRTGSLLLDGLARWEPDRCVGSHADGCLSSSRAEQTRLSGWNFLSHMMMCDLKIWRLLPRRSRLWHEGASRCQHRIIALFPFIGLARQAVPRRTL